MYSGTGNANNATDASSASGAGRTPTIPYPILHHHPQVQQHPLMIHLPPSPQPFFASGSGSGGGDEEELPKRDERFPQWGNQETKDLIEIRAQLEWEFTATKRTRNLWEMVATRMREKGYRRTSEQCKCKWKNLVNRYKGQEASDVERGRLCPFFDELHAVFTVRANRMNQTQVDSETGTLKVRKRDQSQEDISEEQDEDAETEINQAGKGQNVPKRKTSKQKRPKTGEKETYPAPSPGNENRHDSILETLQEILRNFIKQQQLIDAQWRESMEKRAEEREMFEQEWREKMEKLERERLMMEQAWREREELRKMKEESRAEKRDALLTTLLNKLITDKSP